MRYLFWLFAVVCVVVWLIGLAILIAERIQQKYKLKTPKWLSKAIEKYSKWLCLFLIAMSLNGCCKTIAEPIEYPSCPPMLREATYKAMQADERRDYRIAIEKCRIGENYENGIKKKI